MVNMAQMVDFIPLISTVIAVGTAIVTIQKVTGNIKKNKDEMEAEILEKAQAQIDLEKIRLEAKIEMLQKELQNLELTIVKDIEHVKETYQGEMKQLASKIEDLRGQIQQQHSQLLQFLSKLVGQ